MASILTALAIVSMSTECRSSPSLQMEMTHTSVFAKPQNRAILMCLLAVVQIWLTLIPLSEGHAQ